MKIIGWVKAELLRRRRIKRLAQLKAKYIGQRLAFEPDPRIREYNRQHFGLRTDFKYDGVICNLIHSEGDIIPEVEIHGRRFCGPAIEERFDASD